jgi:G3E family GTPase
MVATPVSGPPPIPVTLLTGFLGSGKTTLLNHLICDPGMGRVAVIINEFGDIGLDHDLIEEATEEVVLLQSGCLCCTIRGDLVTAMLALLRRRDAGEVAFDRVVIETTGLADPGPILHTLLMDCTLAHAYQLDGVVTTACAVTGPGSLDAQFEAVNQVALADRIVLTKTDLVTTAERQSFEDRLARINPGALLIVADHGRVDPGVLFGISGLRADADIAQTLGWVNASAYQNDAFAVSENAPELAPLMVAAIGQNHGLFAPQAPDPLASLSLGFLKPKAPAGFSLHDSRITSVSITLDDSIPPAAFDRWLDTLIALRGPDILRVKGIVFLEGIETPFVFHGVQHVFDRPVPMRTGPGSDRRSRIVVIARDMSRLELARSLDMLRARLSETNDALPF